MRKFETTYKGYEVLRKQLNDDCIEFIKEVAMAWQGKQFPLQTINREFDVDDAYCCIVYDGGNHPEYASNACSEVESVFLDENGNVALSIEDCGHYGIDRVECSDLDTIAFALDACIDYMLDNLIMLIGGEGTIENGKWTISRETWDRLVDLAEGRDDIFHYFDEDEGEKTILELADCYYPKGFVTLIKRVAQIGEQEVTWEWGENIAFTREQKNDGVSNDTIEKISWYLTARHNMFHADMIQRAMFDENISLADFITGTTEIVVSERDTDDDEFTPTQFQNDWKEQMQDKMRDYVLHHGENHSDYEQKVVWDHYGCFCRLLIGDRMWDMYRIIPHTDGHVEFDFVDEDGNDLDKNLMNLSVEQIQIIAKALNIK